MTSADSFKQQAALAALAYVPTTPGTIIGVGTGSTATFFIDALADAGRPLGGAVASSEATARHLTARGIRVLDLNEVTQQLAVYVDGADEITPALAMIKGGGGALTREKIVAAASRLFVCIAHEAKLVEQLGAFPLPVEVIPMARALVARQLTALGGQPTLREGFVTDNGNVILDVAGLTITDPAALEAEINQWAGVMTVGLFARRPADVALLAGESGVRTV